MQKAGDELYRAYFVDDEPHALERLAGSSLWSSHGYQVVGFSTDPKKALSEIKKLSPDVVFADLKMPELTGVELMEMLREKGMECEFVIISAYPEFDSSRRFFTKKGFDYLVKPVSDDDLLILLEKLTARLAGKRGKTGMDESTASPDLNNMLAYLKENLAAKHTLESLSEKFSTNNTYVCELFSNYLGTTFVSYMTKLRMETAAEFLKDKNRSVKEIAGLCGYDYLYFVQVFKKFYACSPTSFREGLG